MPVDALRLSDTAGQGFQLVPRGIALLAQCRELCLHECCLGLPRIRQKSGIRQSLANVDFADALAPCIAQGDAAGIVYSQRADLAAHDALSADSVARPGREGNVSRCSSIPVLCMAALIRLFHKNSVALCYPDFGNQDAVHLVAMGQIHSTSRMRSLGQPEMSRIHRSPASS